MSELKVADMLKYANLQMAAEAFLRDPNTGILATTTSDVVNALKAGNNHASRFTQQLAEQFADQWTVVDQIANTTTGFSGTLFRANKDDPDKGIRKDDLVISFRSTEFLDDAVRDSKATNEFEIKDTGWAWGQISDMEAWYADLKNRGLLPDGQQVSVTGYSLGGHLATTFNLLLGNSVVKEIVTFNGAGVGLVNEGSTLEGVLGEFNGLRSNSCNQLQPEQVA
jgi:hypothetical protein